MSLTLDDPAIPAPFEGAPRRRRWSRLALATCVLALLAVAGISAGVLTESGSSTLSSPSGVSSTGAGSGTKLPVPPSGSPWRVLVVGDSTALTLEWDLAQTASSYETDVFSGATFMCGVAIGTEASSENGKGPTMSMVPPCNSATPPSQQWPALWHEDLAEYDPQLVVLLAGRWELTDRIYEGRWMNILDPPFASYVERQLELAAQIATSRGAHIDMLTTACADSAAFFASRHVPDTAVNDDSNVRLAEYNKLVREVAKSTPNASVVDFDALLCPGGKYHRYLDGVEVRPLDGVHTPSYLQGNPFVTNSTPQVANAFAAWLGPRLWPELLAGLEPTTSH